MSVNILNHYWIIGGSATDVYSSATNTMVPVADAAYVAWAANNTASPIGSETELADVLRNYGSPLPAWLLATQPTFIQPTPTTYTQSQLAAYSADARWRRRNDGIIITSLSAIAFLTDDASVNDINSSYNYGQANPAATFKWKMSDGSFVALTATTITTVHNDALNYVQSCFDCEYTTVNSINGGSITTRAQVDAAFAAISNVFS